VNTVIIVQARMTSTRLPGKILKPVLGKSLLEYQIERLHRVHQANALCVATTVNDSDEPVVTLCQTLKIPTFRGSEADVLGRYYGAAQAAQADAVVRVTSDCPLIDPAIVDEVITTYLQRAEHVDYVSNTLERTYPRGLDVEIFPFNVLEQAHREATQPEEREHVTPFIYRHPERYRIAQVKQVMDHSIERWTVDTPEDFELIRRVIEALYPNTPEFNQTDVLALLDTHPDWRAINADVEQKAILNG
jgi:spore coat polysaccharide biosynthesis protein SpsF